MPIIITELLAILGPWIMRFFAVKGVLMVGGFLSRIGLVLMTDKMVVQPLIDAAMQAWATVPPEFQCWFGAIGVTKMASIMVSALTLIAAKRVFFGKSQQ